MAHPLYFSAQDLTLFCMVLFLHHILIAFEWTGDIFKAQIECCYVIKLSYWMSEVINLIFSLDFPQCLTMF